MDTLPIAKYIHNKYVYFTLANFAKYVNSMGVGRDEIVINVSQEYIDDLSGGLLHSDEKFFQLYDFWAANVGRFALDPLGFKQMVFSNTSNHDFAAGRIEIPSEIEGVPVRTNVTGRFRPLIFMPTTNGDGTTVPDYQQYARPFQGGYSIGHIDITAGTFTCPVWDKRTSKMLILSNKHVFSPLVNGVLPTTKCIGDPKVGDAILQPGAYDILNQQLGDKTDPKFLVANFLRQGDYRPWWVGARLKFDSAVATPIDESVCTRTAYGIDGDLVDGTVDPVVDMHVRLAGRTSGYRDTTITQTSMWVPMCTCEDQYIGGSALNCCIPTPLFSCLIWGPDVRIMEDLFETGPNTAAPGDSGSIAVSDDNRVVGQLFGGDASTGIGVCGKASNIEKGLDVSFTKLLAPVLPTVPWTTILAAGTLLAGAAVAYPYIRSKLKV